MRWALLDRFYLEKWILELTLDMQWTEARRTAGVGF
jgi:hypothetical protein